MRNINVKELNRIELDTLHDIVKSLLSDIEEEVKRRDEVVEQEIQRLLEEERKERARKHRKKTLIANAKAKKDLYREIDTHTRGYEVGDEDMPELRLHFSIECSEDDKYYPYMSLFVNDEMTELDIELAECYTYDSAIKHINKTQEFIKEDKYINSFIFKYVISL